MLYNILKIDVLEIVAERIGEFFVQKIIYNYLNSICVISSMSVYRTIFLQQTFPKNSFIYGRTLIFVCDRVQLKSKTMKSSYTTIKTCKKKWPRIVLPKYLPCQHDNRPKQYDTKVAKLLGKNK